MTAVSFLGNAEFLLPFMVILIFGVDPRRGFALLHLILWTAALTALAKAWISYPRPDLVDARVLALGQGSTNVSPFIGMDAPSFWSGLPQQVVEYYRTVRPSDGGIPSAHASIAVSLWGGIALMMRKRWITMGVGLLIVLTGISRMYLGKHFLADVLAGLALGGALLAVAVTVARSTGAAERLNEWARRSCEIYLIGLPLLVWSVPSVEASQASMLFGLDLGFLVWWRRTDAIFRTGIWQRIIRLSGASLAIALGVLGASAFNSAAASIPASMAAALGGFLAFAPALSVDKGAQDTSQQHS